ncbi:hypothetical protein SAMN04488544_0549 [Microlunatus sagamiharensis]|uniref:Uncharacterized protein n=1 Tax=Microlunatus sagamiharensis TaxID=546874 RepID=A0A1H2LNQ1_9ACTN|nr:hypothetical protein [Microlunatus sagamiharensis]SDU82549.1 hypothetical protein SAMN04488544_0549 [Microlunatus sagamiharensis]
MSKHPFEAPTRADLEHLPVEILSEDDLGVLSVRAWAKDGESVKVTWDVLARSFTVWWRSADAERLTVYRELVVQVSVNVELGAVVFRCWSQGADLKGTLVVRVAETVTVTDATLQS